LASPGTGLENRSWPQGQTASTLEASLMGGGFAPDLRERLQRTLGDNYTIERELGGGGMSRVFVAREIELGRDVVVKVLPPDLGAGLNIDRFRREIQMAARLQHPHIVPVLAAGAKDGILFYTMPCIEGETLRSRILRSGELPVGDTIRILRDVADALEYAHAHGVVHRDIKPENVLISGHHALVTDFGVAKALSAATGQSNLTSVGVALGTPTYMSPEQATADPMTDQRTDIYALGVLGYELLSGRPPFSGANPQQVLAAQMTEAPVPISKHRANIPPSLASLIVRCLEKKPADRFQSAEEVREQLEMAGTPSGGTVPTQPVAATASAPPDSGRKRTLIFASVATFLLLGSLIASRYLGGSREQFELGVTQQITNDLGAEITPALSPDGKMLAYAGGDPTNPSIFVRQVGGGPAIRLARGIAPQWSPDGSKLVYVDSAGIAMVPALGGSPSRLIRGSDTTYTTSPIWSHDGRSLAYTVDNAIWIADADGTNPRKIFTSKEPHSLSWSPDDGRLAFVEGNVQFVYGGQTFGNIAPSTLWTIGRDGKGAVPLTDSIHHSVSPAWTSDGDGVLYVSNIRGGRDLYYQHVRGNKADGPAQRLTTGLTIHGIAVGGEGRIAYSVWSTSVGIWSLPFPRSGAVSVASAHQLTSATERIEDVSLSRDGQWLAFDSDRSGNMDIYRIRIDGTGLQQLTRNPADEFRPLWSPDGQQISFLSWRSGNRDLYVMSGDGSAERLISGGPAQEFTGTWSPDGTQLAFWSDRTGREEIYLIPATGGNARRLTLEGGGRPLWSRDGKFIAYSTLDASLRVIPAQGGRERGLVAPTVLGFVSMIGGWSADSRKIYFRVLAPDGSLNIAQVSLDGSNPSLLVRFDDPERRGYRPEFSTDGKTIYFTVGKHEADIWVMDLKKK
jgi:Tol biopolymer transport system component/serine/threonine protein kinase